MATLKVKIEEDIIIDNQDYGSKRTLEISSIDEIFKRIVTCVASQTTTVAVFSSNKYASAGAIDLEDSKYIRITNLDSSNSVELAVVGDSTLYQVRLNAGQSHMLGEADDLILAEADTSPSFGTMEDVASLQVNPGGNAVKVEVFIASA